MTSPSDQNGLDDHNPSEGGCLDPKDQADWERALKEAVDWSILLDDDPDNPRLRAEFDAWNAENPLHGRAWEETSHASRLIAQTKPATSRLQTRKQSGRRARTTRSKSRVRVVAALAAAVVLVWLGGSQMILTAGADIVTGTAEQRSVALPDGSSLRLAPESALRFSNAAGSREATIMAGEAYFDVSRDPSRPFVVTLERATVTVLGTGFNVRVGPETTDVAVKHGRLQVDARNGAQDSIVLEAGRWARISPDGRVSGGTMDPEQVGGWSDTRIVAVDRPLSDVLADVRRYHRGAIILTDEVLAQRSVTGVFDVSDPAAALRLIVKPHDGKLRQITPWLLLVSPS